VQYDSYFTGSSKRVLSFSEMPHRKKKNSHVECLQ